MHGLFLKAITYLQSAQRLKGEDMVEADDISEIAGVRSNCKYSITFIKSKACNVTCFQCNMKQKIYTVTYLYQENNEHIPFGDFSPGCTK